MKSIRRGSVQVHTHNPASGRNALFGMFVALALIVGAIRLPAQEVSGVSRGTVRSFVGAFIPTGDQRDLLEDAVLVGAQASWKFNSNLGLTASFGWTPSTDKVTPGSQTLDAFQFDVGVEASAAQLRTTRVTPFLGLGAGGRTYSYRDLDIESKTNFAGYGALGVDIDAGPLSVRLEARDYVSRFQPLTGGGDTKTRNDVALFTGLGIRF